MGDVKIVETSDLYSVVIRFKARAVANVSPIQWGGSRIAFINHTEIETAAAPSNVKRVVRNTARREVIRSEVEQ
jgi:hypothetical protein